MYNEDRGVLGVGIAVPAILGLTMDQSIVLYVVLATFLLITFFYLIFKLRNRKESIPKK